MSIRNFVVAALAAGILAAQQSGPVQPVPAQPGQIRLPGQPGPVTQPGQVAQPGQLAQPKIEVLGRISSDPLAAPEKTNPDQPAPPTLDPADQTDDGTVFKLGVFNVTAPVTVYDKKGNFVNGLIPLDFELLDNGKPQKITEDVATHPISLVVAVQASSTMEALLPSIRKIGPLFESFILGENGEMAVLAFDHRIQTMTGFTNDPKQVNDAFKKIQAGSSTSHLNDAARDAVYLLKTRPPTRRKILLLISETRDYGSEAHVRDVMTEAEFLDVVVYSVDVSHFLTSITAKHEPPRPNAIPPEARTLPMGVIGTQTTDAQNNMGDWTPAFKEIFAAVKGIFIPNPLEVYTKYSGGREYSYMTQKGLEQALTDIGHEIHSQYMLTYKPNDLDEGGFHEITVNIVTKGGLTVRTRNGYWAAAKYTGQSPDDAQKDDKKPDDQKPDDKPKK